MIEGKAVEFGTSGKLYNSNLVMYDRKTDTYWSQLDGLAIYGELTGTQLKQVPMETVVWRDWKKQHPDSIVLSQDTGYFRNYGMDPYGGYYEDTFLLFPVKNRDDRIHPKTVIFGIEIEGNYKAYREDDLIESGPFEDNLAGISLKIERDDAGTVTVTNTATGEQIIEERTFWFAWYAFHPETGLYPN